MRIKGETTEFWMEELRDYKIHSRCHCGECQTFYLTPPEGPGAFNREYMCTDFNNTTVILHETPIGQLTECEVPQISDVPYAEELKHFGDSEYCSDVSRVEALEIVQKWVTENNESATFTLVIE